MKKDFKIPLKNNVAEVRFTKNPTHDDVRRLADMLLRMEIEGAAHPKGCDCQVCIGV